MTNAIPARLRTRQGLFGAIVLLVLAGSLFALIGPGTPLERYLADRDAGVAITGRVTEIRVAFSCYSPRSQSVGNSPTCHGVRVAVLQSADTAVIPVGAIVAVSTTTAYTVGDVFTGSTGASSHGNLTTTLTIVAAILAVCGVVGGARFLMVRRSS